MLTVQEYILATRRGGGPSPMPWPPAPRNPLPPCPPLTATQQSAVWALDASGAYTQTLPYAPPKQPDVHYFRGRFNGVECKGIPFFTGNSQKTPEISMTWFLPWFSDDWQRKYLDQYAGVYGLTHIVLSIPQARTWGFLNQRLIDCAALCKTYGLFVCVVVFGGDGESWDDVRPWLDRLVGATAVDRLCVAWQADHAYGDSPLDLFDRTLQCGLYARQHGLCTDIHWVNDSCSWYDAQDSPRNPADTWTKYGVFNRFNYQIALGTPDAMSAYGKPYVHLFADRLGKEYAALSGAPVLNAHYFQCDTEAPINNIQAAIVAVLHAIPPGTIRFVAGEYEAQAEFDQRNFPPRLPWCGDQKGFLMNCTSAYGQTVDGYLDGGLLPGGGML